MAGFMGGPLLVGGLGPGPPSPLKLGPAEGTVAQLGFWGQTDSNGQRM